MISPNRAMYMRPHDVPPSAWLGHIPFAGWIVSALRPRNIVELGTHYGTSFLAFCQAIQEQGIKCEAYAVDTWQGDPHAGIYGAEVYDQLSSLHASKYASFSKLLRMTFDEALSCFDDGSIDLLHIDGMHTYDAVKHDFDTWLPKLSNRSIVLFHDIFERERDFGVWKFWDEVAARYPAHAFTHSHGLGVIAIGDKLPGEVRELFESSDDDRLLTNLMFERAASHIEIEAEITRLQSAVQHERAIRHEADRLDLVNMQAELRGDLAYISSALSSRFEDMRMNTTFLVQSLDRSVCGLIGEEGGVASIKEDVRSFLDASKTVTSEFAAGLSDANERIQANLIQLAEVDKHEFSMLSVSLMGIQDALKAMHEESMAAYERVGHLNQRMDTIEAQGEQLAKRVAVLQQGVTTIQERRWWNNLIRMGKK